MRFADALTEYIKNKENNLQQILSSDGFERCTKQPSDQNEYVAQLLIECSLKNLKLLSDSAIRSNVAGQIKIDTDSVKRNGGWDQKLARDEDVAQNSENVTHALAWKLGQLAEAIEFVPRFHQIISHQQKLLTYLNQVAQLVNLVDDAKEYKRQITDFINFIKEKVKECIKAFYIFYLEDYYLSAIDHEEEVRYLIRQFKIFVSEKVEDIEQPLLKSSDKILIDYIYDIQTEANHLGTQCVSIYPSFADSMNLFLSKVPKQFKAIAPNA